MGRVRVLTSHCELITPRSVRGCMVGGGVEVGVSVEEPLASVVMEVARSRATSAVFHRINVTGERRLRFNYYANLRFNRACAPDARNGPVAS